MSNQSETYSLQTLLDAIKAISSTGDQNASQFLQSFQGSPSAWQGIHQLCSLNEQRDGMPALPLVHYYASMMAFSKVKAEWGVSKQDSPLTPEVQSQIHSILVGHLQTISTLAHLYVAPYTHLFPTVLNNFSRALAMISLISHDCLGYINYALHLASSSQHQLALVLLTALPQTFKEMHFIYRIETQLTAQMAEHVPTILNFCESVVLPLVPLLDPETNPTLFSTLATSLIYKGAASTPIPPAILEANGNASHVEIYPYHATSPQHGGSSDPHAPHDSILHHYAISPFRPCHAYAPLVPLKSMLRCPETIPTHELFHTSNLLHFYRFYPHFLGIGTTNDSNIITMTLDCLSAWGSLLSPTILMSTQHKGVLLLVLLSLLLFDRYSIKTCDILQAALRTCTFPPPTNHHSIITLITKTLAEWSVRLVPRMLYSWVFTYNEETANGQTTLLSGLDDHFQKVVANDRLPPLPSHLAPIAHHTISIPSIYTMFPRRHQFAAHQTALMSHAKQSAQAYPRVSPQNYSSSPLDAIYPLWRFFEYTVSTESSPPETYPATVGRRLHELQSTYLAPFAAHAHPQHALLFQDLSARALFEAYGSLEHSTKLVKQLIELVSLISLHDSTYFMRASNEVITLTNMMMITLAHPNVGVSLVSLEFFLELQTTFVASRSYCFQTPIFVYLFTIVLLQLTSKGMALFWLCQNIDLFDNTASSPESQQYLQRQAAEHNKDKRDNDDDDDDDDDSIPAGNKTIKPLPVASLDLDHFISHESFTLTSSQPMLQALDTLMSQNSNLFSTVTYPVESPNDGNCISAGLSWQVLTSYRHHLLSWTTSNHSDHQQQHRSSTQHQYQRDLHREIRQCPDEQLYQYLLYPLNSTSEYSPVDLSNMTLFQSLEFFEFVSDALLHDQSTANDHVHYFNAITDVISDIYELLQSSMITFLFRALGLHLQPSLHVQMQQHSLCMDVNTHFNLHDIDPHSSQLQASGYQQVLTHQQEALSGALRRSSNPTQHQPFMFPSTQVVLNNGCLFDDVLLLPFPRLHQAVVPQHQQQHQQPSLTPVSLLEFYAYIQHISPEHQQLLIAQASQSNSPIHTPYVIHPSLDYSIYIRFVQSTFKLASSLAEHIKEGMSSDMTSLQLIDTQRRMMGQASQISTTIDGYADRVANTMHHISSIVQLFHHYILHISQLPLLPSFHMQAASSASSSQTHSDSFNASMDISTSIQNIYTEPASLDSWLSRTPSQSIRQQSFSYCPPLSLLHSQLFVHYAFITPILHPAAIHQILHIAMCLNAKTSVDSISLLSVLSNNTSLVQQKRSIDHHRPDQRQGAASGAGEPLTSLEDALTLIVEEFIDEMKDHHQTHTNEQHHHGPHHHDVKSLNKLQLMNTVVALLNTVTLATEPTTAPEPLLTSQPLSLLNVTTLSTAKQFTVIEALTQPIRAGAAVAAPGLDANSDDYIVFISPQLLSIAVNIMLLRVVASIVNPLATVLGDHMMKDPYSIRRHLICAEYNIYSTNTVYTLLPHIITLYSRRFTPLWWRLAMTNDVTLSHSNGVTSLNLTQCHVPYLSYATSFSMHQDHARQAYLSTLQQFISTQPELSLLPPSQYPINPYTPPVALEQLVGDMTLPMFLTPVASSTLLSVLSRVSEVIPSQVAYKILEATLPVFLHNVANLSRHLQSLLDLYQTLANTPSTATGTDNDPFLVVGISVGIDTSKNNAIGRYTMHHQPHQHKLTRVRPYHALDGLIYAFTLLLQHRLTASSHLFFVTTPFSIYQADATFAEISSPSSPRKRVIGGSSSSTSSSSGRSQVQEFIAGHYLGQFVENPSTVKQCSSLAFQQLVAPLGTSLGVLMDLHSVDILLIDVKHQLSIFVEAIARHQHIIHAYFNTTHLSSLYFTLMMCGYQDVSSAIFYQQSSKAAVAPPLTYNIDSYIRIVRSNDETMADSARVVLTFTKTLTDLIARGITLLDSELISQHIARLLSPIFKLDQIYKAHEIITIISQTPYHVDLFLSHIELTWSILTHFLDVILKCVYEYCPPAFVHVAQPSTASSGGSYDGISALLFFQKIVSSLITVTTDTIHLHAILNEIKQEQISANTRQQQLTGDQRPHQEPFDLDGLPSSFADTLALTANMDTDANIPPGALEISFRLCQTGSLPPSLIPTFPLAAGTYTTSVHTAAPVLSALFKLVSTAIQLKPSYPHEIFEELMRSSHTPILTAAQQSSPPTVTRLTPVGRLSAPDGDFLTTRQHLLYCAVNSSTQVTSHAMQSINLPNTSMLFSAFYIFNDNLFKSLQVMNILALIHIPRTGVTLAAGSGTEASERAGSTSSTSPTADTRTGGGVSTAVQHDALKASLDCVTSMYRSLSYSELIFFQLTQLSMSMIQNQHGSYPSTVVNQVSPATLCPTAWKQVFPSACSLTTFLTTSFQYQQQQQQQQQGGEGYMLLDPHMLIRSDMSEADIACMIHDVALFNVIAVFTTCLNYTLHSRQGSIHVQSQPQPQSPQPLPSLIDGVTPSTDPSRDVNGLHFHIPSTVAHGTVSSGWGHATYQRIFSLLAAPLSSSPTVNDSSPSSSAVTVNSCIPHLPLLHLLSTVLTFMEHHPTLIGRFIQKYARQQEQLQLASCASLRIDQRVDLRGALFFMGDIHPHLDQYAMVDPIPNAMSPIDLNRVEYDQLYSTIQDALTPTTTNTFGGNNMNILLHMLSKTASTRAASSHTAQILAAIEPQLQSFLSSPSTSLINECVDIALLGRVFTLFQEALSIGQAAQGIPSPQQLYVNPMRQLFRCIQLINLQTTASLSRVLLHTLIHYIVPAIPSKLPTPLSSFPMFFESNQQRVVFPILAITSNIGLLMAQSSIATALQLHNRPLISHIQQKEGVYGTYPLTYEHRAYVYQLIYKLIYKYRVYTDVNLLNMTVLTFKPLMSYLSPPSNDQGEVVAPNKQRLQSAISSMERKFKLFLMDLADIVKNPSGNQIDSLQDHLRD